MYSTALENIKFSPQQSEILADWRPSIFQIIPTLIGSGLTLFVFNNLVADINQPHVFLDVQQYDANINSNSNKSNYNNQIKFHNVAINDGRSPTTNLRLSISYPNYNITNYRTSFQSENATFSYINNTLLVELKRLSSGSALAIDTIARCINNYTSPVLASTTTVQTCAPNYVVTASYDQGSTFKSNIESPILTASTFLNAHIRNQVIILATTFAIASFVIALSLKRIRRFKRRLELSIFVFNILKEIVYIRDHLQQNVLSQKIFHLEPWLSKDQDDRRHVFDDYADYKLIDNFYKKLKERDNDLSDKNIDHEELKRYNNECLVLATNTIEKINWTDYQDLEDRKYYYPLTMMITAPCALIVFFAFEAYKVPFVLFLLGLPSQYYVSVYYIFTVFARTLVSFILAREIINFQTSFSYEIGVDNNFLSYYTLLLHNIPITHEEMKSLVSASVGSGWARLHPESLNIPANITTLQQLKPGLPPEIVNNQNNVGKHWEDNPNWSGACDELAKLAKPTLVITGTDDDKYQPHVNSLKIVEKIPGAWLIQIKDAGHAVMDQYQAEISKILQTFLSTTTTTPSN